MLLLELLKATHTSEAGFAIMLLQPRIKLYVLLTAVAGKTFSDSFFGTEHCSAGVDVQCGGPGYITVEEIREHVYDKCMLLSLHPVTPDTHSNLSKLYTVFKNDSNVFIGHLVTRNVSDIRWKNTVPNNSTRLELAFYAREKRDRSCLLLPPRENFLAELYVGMIVVETLVQFINEKCGTFRTPSGGLTEEGLLHQHIMHNLYAPSQPVKQCHRQKFLPSKLDFFRDYAYRSRPVVFENAISSWPALQKWTAEYLRQQYGEKMIHIKLTPNGVFEGVEPANIWSDYSEDWIPAEVKSQLSYPDLVVVRPATREMKFSEFLDFISSGNRTFSAYLEYSSIPYYMPKLQQDIFELPFVEGSLEIRHLNMWLSDGNTLGKLHFDPFDNLLCQVKNTYYALAY